MLPSTSSINDDFIAEADENIVFLEIKNLLLDLLSQQDVIKPAPLTQVPGSYGEVLQLSILTEWYEEKEKLKLYIESAENLLELKYYFKRLCFDRENANEGTALHFLSSPEGLCNQLYWNLALQLFAPKNLGEMVSIIMPYIENVLIIEETINVISQANKKETLFDRYQPKLTMGILSVDLAHLPANNPILLTQCTAGNQVILHLDEVARLPFQLHIKLHDALDVYPELKRNFYSHNDSFQQLLTDIEWQNQKGISPNTAFSRFITTLIQSGSHYTGTIYAGSRAILACTQFQNYIENLPEEIRKITLSLKFESISLENVLTFLEQGECVETAAENLMSIKSAHFDFLNRNYSDPNIYRKEIEQRYHRKSLDIIGYQSTQFLPHKLQKQILSKIRIYSAANYIDCIINLPMACYENFLESVQILSIPALPKQLAYELSMFSSHQRKAFLRAAIKNANKLGGNRAILLFCMMSQNSDPNELRETLSLFTKQSLLDALYKRNNNGDVLLHHVIRKGFECIETLLTMLSEEDRLISLNQKDNRGFTTFFWIAAQNCGYAKKLLSQLSEIHQLIILNEKGKEGFTIFYLIAFKYPTCAKMLFLTLSKKSQLSALNEKDEAGLTTFLHIIFKNPKYGKMLLALLSEKDRLCILNESHEKNFTTFYYVVFKNFKYAKKLFTLLSKQDQIAVLNKKDKDGFTTFFRIYFIGFEYVKKSLLLLSKQDRLAVLSEKDITGFSIFYRIVSGKLEYAEILLRLLPKKDRLIFLNEGGLGEGSFAGFTLFYNIFLQNPELTKTLFILLPEKDRPAALNKKCVKGYTVFRLLSYEDQECAKFLLALLTEKEQLAVLNKRGFLDCFSTNWNLQEILPLLNADNISDLNSASYLTNTIAYSVWIYHHVNYLLEAVLLIKKESYFNRYYSEKLLDINSKFLSQIKAYLTEDTTSQNFNTTHEFVHFLPQRLEKIKTLIKEKIIYPKNWKPYYFQKFAFILLNSVLFFIPLVRFFLRLKNPSRYPHILWTPGDSKLRKRAKRCQSEITKVQQQVQKYLLARGSFLASQVQDIDIENECQALLG